MKFNGINYCQRSIVPLASYGKSLEAEIELEPDL